MYHHHHHQQAQQAVTGDSPFVGNRASVQQAHHSSLQSSIPSHSAQYGEPQGTSPHEETHGEPQPVNATQQYAVDPFTQQQRRASTSSRFRAEAKEFVPSRFRTPVTATSGTTSGEAAGHHPSYVPPQVGQYANNHQYASQNSGSVRAPQAPPRPTPDTYAGSSFSQAPSQGPSATATSGVYLPPSAASQRSPVSSHAGPSYFQQPPYSPPATVPGAALPGYRAPSYPPHHTPSQVAPSFSSNTTRGEGVAVRRSVTGGVDLVNTPALQSQAPPGGAYYPSQSVPNTQPMSQQSGANQSYNMPSPSVSVAGMQHPSLYAATPTPSQPSPTHQYGQPQPQLLRPTSAVSNASYALPPQRHPMGTGQMPLSQNPSPQFIPQYGGNPQSMPPALPLSGHNGYPPHAQHAQQIPSGYGGSYPAQ